MTYRVNGWLTILDRGEDSIKCAGDLALQALAWVLSDAARASRFLGVTGLTPDALRATLTDSATQQAVLAFLCAHEPDLIAAGEALGVAPQELAAAQEALGR